MLENTSPLLSNYTISLWFCFVFVLVVAVDFLLLIMHLLLG